MILDRRIVTMGSLNMGPKQEVADGPVLVDGQCEPQGKPSAWQTMTDCLEKSYSLPRTWRVIRELGDRHAGRSDFDTARECYLLAHCLAPKEPEPLVRFGVLAMQNDDLDDAQRAFEKASRLDPKCAEAYNGSAMVLQMRKDYPAAFETYLKGLELNPDNLTALLGLFQTSCQMGTFSKIIHYLEVYLARHPGDTEVLACLAALYGREGQTSKARETLSKVREIEANSDEAAQMEEEESYLTSGSA